MTDDDDKQAKLERMNTMFVATVPHSAAIGVRMVDYGPGTAAMRLPYDPKLIGNPVTGVIHGGALTSLLDATCGAAVFMKLQKPLRIATLDLRIDHLAAPTPGLDIIAEATCYRVTRHIAFVRALAHEASADGADRPVASAAATFALFRHGRSRFARSEQGK